MINYVNYEQAKSFVSLCSQILKYGIIDDSFVMIQNMKSRTLNDSKLDNFHKNFTVFSLNPIKEWVMVLNILMLLRYKFTEIKYITNDLINLYSNTVDKILNSTEDIRQINRMLTEELLNTKEVIDVISECDLQIILNNPSVSRIVQNFWDGPYESESILNKSSIFNEIHTKLTQDKKILNQDKIEEYKYSIAKIKTTKMLEKKEDIMPCKLQKSHFFHFQRWNHSLRVKFFAEAILIIIISLSMFIWARDALEKSIHIDSLVTDYNSYSSQLQNSGLTSDQLSNLIKLQKQSWSQVLSDSEYYISLIKEAWAYWILIVPFLLKDIQQIVYASLRKKDSSFSNGIMLVSLISAALAGELTYSLFFDYMKVTPQTDPDYYYKVYKATQYHVSYWSLQHTFGTLLAFQFTRIFFFLAATRVFGPMVHIILSMLFEVIKISLIEFSIMIVFFCFGRLWFYTIPAFDSDIHAFSTLLGVSLGNFDLTIFDDPSIKFSKYYGYVYMYIFIWISTVTLLNFVIAIITHVYDYKSKIGVGLYLKTIILMRQVLDSNEKYSSIAFMVPPLNFITFLFTPFLVWFGNK